MKAPFAILLPPSPHHWSVLHYFYDEVQNLSPSFCPCLWFPVVIAASFSGAFCSQVECALRYLKLGERTSRYKWTEMLWLWVAGWWVDWGVEVRWEGRESHLLKTQIALHETPSALLLWPSSLCTLHCPPQFFLTVFFFKIWANVTQYFSPSPQYKWTHAKNIL